MAEQMDYEACEKASQGFTNVSGMFKRISVALEAAIRLLQSTAFIGAVGGAAVEHYLSNIKPRVDQLAVTCQELSEEVVYAIQKRRESEAEASSQFKS